jgi:oxygen-independent coproporphyrinogen-3 oxidase
VARHVAQGWLDDDGIRVRFTREGLFLADTVLCDLL